MRETNNVLIATLNDSVATIISFIPRFLSGLVILLIGVIIATVLKQLVREALKFLRFETFIKRYGVPESKETADWTTILSEITRWFVIIVFLVPTADVWGLANFAEVLNNLLFFLPNLLISILLLLVGFVISKLVYDLIFASLSGITQDNARAIAMIGRWAVLVFAVLVVLNQLGIESDLIRIILSGIVAMFALPGGLAFGLGGKDAAKDLIEKFRRKM